MNNRRNPRWRFVVFLLPLALLALLLVARTNRSENGESASPGVLLSQRSVVVPPLPARLEPRSTPAVVDEMDVRSAALSERLRAANAARKAAVPVPAKMERIAAGPDPKLIPRQAALSKEQLGRLNALRWRQPGKWVDWRTAPDRPSLTYLEGRRLEQPAEAADPGLTLAQTTARRFLRANDVLLGLKDTEAELRLVSESKDDLGYTQIRFSQSYAGLTVWPCALTAQLNPEGALTLMTGAYTLTPNDLNPTPTIDADEALARARAHSLDMRLAELKGRELLIHAPFHREAKLAWRVDLRASLVQQWDVFVDAQDGSILDVGTQVATAGVVGSGTDLKGVSRTLNVWRHTDNLHYMIDTSKAMFDPRSAPPNLAQSRGVIAVLDLRNEVEPDPAKAVHNLANSPTGPWRADAVSAANNLSKVYDYYRARFNRNSVNGEGGSMTGVVNMNQANAYSDFQTLTMTFGNTDHYAEALDVVAHEMTHSVISTTSKLVYQFQSGALNESFADILGEGCEAHFNGGAPDWKMGTALREQGRALDDPGSKLSGLGRPYPSKFSQFEVLDGDQDDGGVHINSSITNHAFYQLAKGLNGAIGLDDALQIFYRAVTTKLNPQSQFVDCRLGCVASANELFGNGSNQSQKTAAAFDVVEIFDQQSRPDTAPIPTVEALDSTLFIFPFGGATYLGRREVGFNDDGGGVFLGANGQRTQVMANKKPAVSGDGSFGLYMLPNGDAAFIDTMNGASTSLNVAGLIESVGLSADGEVQAFVLRTAAGAPDNRILVFDDKTGQSKTYTAVQPLTNQGGEGFTNTILSVDALELTPDGRYVYYDALNRLVFPGGAFLDSYSMYVIDRKNDTISSLIPPIPGVQVGNPSLGQTRTNLITFDVTDANGVGYIYAADLVEGTINLITTLADGAQVNPGWPGYSGDDTAIVYTNYEFDLFSFSFVPYLESQPVQADGLRARGAAFAWLAGSSPTLGFIYRRGQYVGLPRLSITAADPSASEKPGDTGAFRVARTGPTDRALPFSFVLTGTAQNAADFAEIDLSAQIPTGAASVDIIVSPVDDSLTEGSEQVTCSLSEALDYTLDQNDSASVTIEDNDTLSFATWAADNGLGPTDFNGDNDRDGRSNLLEYALGTNPRGLNSVADPRVTVAGGQSTMTVTRSRLAPDVTYTVEVSPTLAPGSWVSGAPHTTILENSANFLRVRNDGAGHYMRLRIVKP